MKFGTRVRLKPSNDRAEFELDRARSKNNIAENSVAQVQDMIRTIVIYSDILCHQKNMEQTANIFLIFLKICWS